MVGTLRLTKALLPGLIASGDGLIVTVTSIAALDVYDNGAGYTSAKHAQGVCIAPCATADRKSRCGSRICPGMVETEFSLVRFDGDQERADATYMPDPLTAGDVAR